MNFEQRKAVAEKLVANFLDDFAPPRSVPDDRLVSRITFIADSFARKMPTTGDFTEGVEKVLMKLRDTHESNTWPSQAEFVLAMQKGERKEFAQLQQFAPDLKEKYQKLMEAKEPVPETVVWGAIANSLGVSSAILESYRKGSAANWQNIYKSDAYGLMRAKYGPEVDLYFHKGAQQ